MFIVPKYEPEVMAAARKRHPNFEKIPTTAIGEIIVGGVSITSRYKNAREYEILGQIVSEMATPTRDLVKAGILR